MTKRTCIHTCAMLAGAAAVFMHAAAHAQFARPDTAVKYRQSAFYVMGQHFSRIGAMANGKIPLDTKLASEDAETVAALAKLPIRGFIAGTETLSAKVKAEAWAEMPKFRALYDNMVVEAGTLAAAARSNNLAQLKAAFAATAAACKACHDQYKN